MSSRRGSTRRVRSKSCPRSPAASHCQIRRSNSFEGLRIVSSSNSSLQSSSANSCVQMLTCHGALRSSITTSVSLSSTKILWMSLNKLVENQRFIEEKERVAAREKEERKRKREEKKAMTQSTKSECYSPLSLIIDLNPPPPPHFFRESC